ncbi:hypothetical protein CHISP_0447 [Chitinispirillum alkaliphilum]|nr:hypothetical protein CHISP_0447 [Chitinispirillum alkaliphilum]
MGKVLALMLAAGCVISSYATDARVVVMGRDDAFYRDEVSIFTNPATVNLYPNMVYGSFGVYQQREGDRSSALNRFNRDAERPFFGAIISNRFTEQDEASLISFAAVFNRHDRMLDYITPVKTFDANGNVASTHMPVAFPDNSSNVNLESPVGRVDLIGSYTLRNGVSIGAGLYLAHQRVTENNNIDFESGVYKGTLGILSPVGPGLELEASVNAGLLTGIGTIDDNELTIADRDWFIRGDLRSFASVPAINGAVVPQASFNLVNLQDGETRLIDFAAGLGLNMNIDRGFFFAGLQGLYTRNDWHEFDSEESYGARVSFGVERNLVWDWFVLRVGGQKVVRYATNGPNSGRWIENPEADGSDEDLVGLGFGVNIEDRFRVDFVAAEDLAYTFTNLFSGPQHHLFKRVSATYRF